MGFFTETITVYNHYMDPGTDRDVWCRSVVPGVQWTHGKRQSSVVNGIATESIEESITIDYRRDYEGRKAYIDPVVFGRLPPEEAGEYWTLNQQSGMDYIVLGECDLDIHKPSELRGHYQYCGVIVSVADRRNRPRLRHIEVAVK